MAPKEQFSDGVGYNWIDTLKEVVEAAVSDEQMANAQYRFPKQTPQNKEEFYYRSIFEEHFPSEQRHSVYLLYLRWPVAPPLL